MANVLLAGLGIFIIFLSLKFWKNRDKITLSLTTTKKTRSFYKEYRKDPVIGFGMNYVQASWFIGLCGIGIVLLLLGLGIIEMKP